MCERWCNCFLRRRLSGSLVGMKPGYTSNPRSVTQETANIIHLEMKYFPSYCIPNLDHLLYHKVSNKILLTQVQRPDDCFYVFYHPATVKVKGLLNLTSLFSGTLQLGLLDPLTFKKYLGEVSYET